MHEDCLDNKQKQTNKNVPLCEHNPANMQHKVKDKDPVVMHKQEQFSKKFSVKTEIIRIASYILSTECFSSIAVNLLPLERCWLHTTDTPNQNKGPFMSEQCNSSTYGLSLVSTVHLSIVMMAVMTLMMKASMTINGILSFFKKKSPVQRNETCGDAVVVFCN